MSERCILTLPLETEKWQEDIINKRFEVQRNVYNKMLEAKIKELNKLQCNKEYRKVTNILYEYAKEGKKSDLEYKDAAKRRNEILREFGFSEFSFKKESIKYGSYFAGSISSTACLLSVATPMWKAFEDIFFRKGKNVHFKKKGTVNSVATDGKSFLRIVDASEKTVRARTNQSVLYVLYGLKGHQVLKMPIKLNLENEYELEMLSMSFKQIRVIRKKEKGRYAYYVQICLEGNPAVKYDKKTGEVKHPVGKGTVGIYVTTKNVTVAVKDKIVSYQLSEGVPNYSDRIAELQQFMDNSRRANNPDNYNSDGTIKKGIVIDGRKRPLTWIYSRNYIKAKEEVSNLKRLERVKRELHHRKLANEILSFGDELHINDYSFAAAAKRSKEDEYNSNGTPKSKKRGGKNISENAPALFIDMLENNIMFANGSVKKYKISDEPDYEESRYDGEKWASFLFFQE